MFFTYRSKQSIEKQCLACFDRKLLLGYPGFIFQRIDIRSLSILYMYLISYFNKVQAILKTDLSEKDI